MSARRECRALSEFPGPMPATLDECYAVQLNSIAAWHDKPAGWKVGGVPAAYIETFNETRLTGPIYSKRVFHAAAGAETEVGVLPGFAAVEPEWAFMLGATPEEDRVFLGVEIASSPLIAINDMGPVAVICDFGNNNGLIVGPEIENWRDLNPGDIHLTTEIEGKIVGEKTVTNFPQDGMMAVAFLRAHAEKHGIDLPVGTFCASGAITGVHESRAGERSVCHFGQFGSLGISLVAAEPVIL